jgi:ABC-type Fe3+/spermidine/putrescine transport system ATPase subunit
LEVADRVLVMSQGRVEQLGTPQEVYESPSSFFVANFVGEANHFSGTVSNGGMDLGPLHFPINEQPNGTRVDVVVRPTDLSVRSVRPGDKIVGRVMSVVYKGNGFGIEVCLMDGTRMGARVGTGNPELLNIGGEVALDVKHFLTFTGAV